MDVHSWRSWGEYYICITGYISVNTTMCNNTNIPVHCVIPVLYVITTDVLSVVRISMFQSIKINCE